MSDEVVPNRTTRDVREACDFCGVAAGEPCKDVRTGNVLLNGLHMVHRRKEKGKHEQHLHLQKQTEESVLPGAHGIPAEASEAAAPAEENTTEIAARVREKLREAKDVLQRIVDNETPYRGGD